MCEKQTDTTGNAIQMSRFTHTLIPNCTDNSAYTVSKVSTALTFL